MNKTEGLSLRTAGFIYMRGRTPYTTGVPLIPLLVRRYVSGISKSGPRTNTLTYSMTHSATYVELDVLNMAVGCVSTEWTIVLEVTRRDRGEDPGMNRMETRMEDQTDV